MSGPDLNKSGGFVNPFMAQNPAIAIMTYNRVKQKTEAELIAEAERLEKILVQVDEQATDKDGNIDFSKVQVFTGTAEEVSGKVLDIHSELCGVQQALQELNEEKARQKKKEEEAMGIYRANMGGNVDPSTPEQLIHIVGTRPSDRFLAFIEEEFDLTYGSKLKDYLSNHKIATPEEQIPLNYTDRQIRQALFGSMASPQVMGATFKTTSWDPWYEREPGFVDARTRPIQVLDIIPMFTTNTDTVAYMEETTYAPAAEEKAEETDTNEAGYALTERTSPVRRISHYIPVTEESMADEGQVRSYLDMRLPFGVMQRADGQVIHGNGAAPNLKGILAEDDIQLFRVTTSGTPKKIVKPWHRIREMKTKIRFTGRAFPTHALLNPIVWEEAILSESSAGGFYSGGPQRPEMDVAWGMRVVETDHLTDTVSGNGANNRMIGGIVGDFTGMYIGMWVRHGVRTEAGLIGDDFKKFRISLRSSFRAAFIVQRAQAFIAMVNAKEAGGVAD